MLLRERVAVYCENHTEHTDTLCGQNAEFYCVKAGGTYSNHWAGVKTHGVNKNFVLTLPCTTALLTWHEAPNGEENPRNRTPKDLSSFKYVM
jgi:hypothetical protein